MTDEFEVAYEDRQQPRSRRDAALAQLASRHFEVVTTAQLRALGFSHRELSYRVGAGRLFRHHRGVYSTVARLGREGRFLAAVRAVGGRAVLSHLAACVHWGLLTGDDVTPEVTVDRRVPGRDGIAVHCVEGLDDREVTDHLGIPVTTAARTLLDLAATGHRGLERAVHEAEVQRRTNVDAIAEVLGRHPGARGVARLRAVIASGPAPTRSPAEDALLAFVDAHGLPRPETNTFVEGLEVDAVYPARRLVVEVDSRYHDTPFARRRDAHRDAVLGAAGYRVVRLRKLHLTRHGGPTAAWLRAELTAAEPALA